MLEMHEKSIGKTTTVRITRCDLIDVRCDGWQVAPNRSIIPLAPVLPPPSRVDVTMTREALRVELVDHQHLSAAAECEDEMEDGACCNVKLACGLVVWPIACERTCK